MRTNKAFAKDLAMATSCNLESGSTYGFLHGYETNDDQEMEFTAFSPVRSLVFWPQNHSDWFLRASMPTNGHTNQTKPTASFGRNGIGGERDTRTTCFATKISKWSRFGTTTCFNRKLGRFSSSKQACGGHR